LLSQHTFIYLSRWATLELLIWRKRIDSEHFLLFTLSMQPINPFFSHCRH
jgi:hypothetical protein